MPREIKVGLVLTADGKGFRGEMRVSEKAMRKFSAGARSAAKSSQQAAQATKSLERSVKGVGDKAKLAHDRAIGYGASLGTLALAGHRRLNPFCIRARVRTFEGKTW